MDSQMPHAGEDYGDYEKFEEGRNEVKEVNERGLDDQGYDRFERNYKEMLRQMDQPDEPGRETQDIKGEEEELIKHTVLNENLPDG